MDNLSQKSGRSQHQNYSHLQTPGRNLNGSFHNQQQIQNNDFQSSQKQKYEKNLNQSGFIQPISVHPLQSDGFQQPKDIYENQITMKLKSQEREDQLTCLTLKIILTPGNNVHGQVLQMELTDELNQLFLYILQLSETDFLQVKNDQNLIVDFNGFPTKLIELLELSLNSNKEDKIQFGCVFEIKSNGEGYLKVTEMNQFKTLVHLALKFRCANDEVLKNYLANKLSKEQNENEELRIKNSRIEEQLQDSQNKNEELNQQLARFQQEREQQEEQLRLDSSKKLHLQKEEYLQRESELRNTYESKHQLIQERLEKQIQDLQNQVQSLQKQNSDLNEVKLNLDSSVRELQSKNKVNEKELDLVNKEIQTLRLDNKNLDSVRFAQEKKITELSVKIESLEKQIIDKDQLISSSKSLNSNNEDQKKMLEKENNEKSQQIDKLEKKLEQCKVEIEKGNDVIDKFREALEKKKKKQKQKETIILQQEQNIQNLQNSIDTLNRQIIEIQREKDNSEIKLKELQTANSDLKTKIQESQKVLEQNQSMIQYLNNQLNNTRPNIPTGLSSTLAGQTSSAYRPNYAATSTISHTKYGTYGNNFSGEDKYSQDHPRSHTPLSYSQKNNNPLHYTNLYSQNMNQGTTYHLTKSPLTKDFDYDNEEKGQENHTNLNSKYTATLGGQRNNNSFSVNNTISAVGEGNIVPIKYRDPTKNQ
ncbi:hypothetical protein ABPG74_000093 [Tetrahymena malaccensis]